MRDVAGRGDDLIGLRDQIHGRKLPAPRQGRARDGLQPGHETGRESGRWRPRALGAVAAHDLTQRKHAILRNFPVVGHLRYQLERFGPELRQYIVTSNDEERPFSRDQRRWVYASLQAREQLLRLRHRQRRRERRGLPDHQAPDVRRPRGADPHARRRGGRCCPRRRCSAGRAAGAHAFRPRSVVNISGMSFGALSRNAIEALNRGAAHGRLPAEHRRGRDLAVPPQRRRAGLPDRDGVLRLPRRATAASTSTGCKDLVASAPVRAIEIKLSQGAKPGLGGMLPGRQGQRGDRRDPRHRARRRLRVAEPAHGVPRRRLDARLRRAGRRPRPGCRSASSRRSATSTSGTTWSG